MNIRVIVAACAVAALCACERGPCPSEMAPVKGGRACIDRWESSAARDAKGVLGPAVSKKGAVPADSVSWQDADASCKAAKKRLCRDEEWVGACQGGDKRKLPYGNAFEPERCNTLQYGRKAGKIEKRAAGSLAGCDNGSGVMDLSGNVWEWTADADQTGHLRRLRGGGFANDNHEGELECLGEEDEQFFQPTAGRHSGIGYRCCADAR